MMSDSGDSLPHIPPDSPGSSVSTRLQEEYDELLKYAVVLPNYDPQKTAHTLSDARMSFPQHRGERVIPISVQKTNQDTEADTEAVTVQHEVRVTQGNSQVSTNLPDFHQSPIRSKDDEKVDGEEDDFEPEKSTSRLSSQYTAPRQTYCPEPGVEREEERFTEEVVYTSTIDPDVAKMENVLDQWSLDLKRNVLAEFGQAKIRIIEKSRHELQKETERYISEKNNMINEIDKLKELLHTYEQSIERKDQVISNLTRALTKQKEKCDMLKKFSEWKLRHNDLKREIVFANICQMYFIWQKNKRRPEAFASNLARRHYERSLSAKVWAAWHSVIETKWRHRVEKACQAKAQEVCLQLTNDYEAKISKLNDALEAAHTKIARMNVERERYEEAMKKAFMRGVCALNLEAMTMFHGEEGEQEAPEGKASQVDDFSDNLESFVPEKEYGPPKTIPQEAVYTSRPTDLPPPRIVTSQGARSATSTLTQSRSNISSRPVSAPSSSRGKVISAKITAKVDSGKSGRNLGVSGTTLAPPMASVIVERHQPVTKATVGKATASKYPASQGPIYRKLAGQGSPVTLSPHIQSVKVVD